MKQETIFKRAYPQLMSVLLKEGESGKVRLKKRTVPAGTMMMMYSPEGYMYHYKYPCDFTTMQLLEGDTLWMTDTPLEIDGIKPALELARGGVQDQVLGRDLAA